MGYRNLRQCVDDLERAGHLVRVDHPISPALEAAEVSRRLGRPVLLEEVGSDDRFARLRGRYNDHDGSWRHAPRPLQSMAASGPSRSLMRSEA